MAVTAVFALFGPVLIDIMTASADVRRGARDFLLFVIAFRSEVWQFLRLIWDVILVIFRRPFPPLSADMPQVLVILAVLVFPAALFTVRMPSPASQIHDMQGPIKPARPLMEPTEKVFAIDGHVGATGSGYIGDILQLIDELRLEAQKHRLSFESPIDVGSLAKHLGGYLHNYTIYAVRPQAASVIVAGRVNMPGVVAPGTVTK